MSSEREIAMKKLFFVLTAIVLIVLIMVSCGSLGRRHYELPEKTTVRYYDSGKEFVLSEEDRALLISVLNNGRWEDSYYNCTREYLIICEDYMIEYSTPGVFTHIGSLVIGREKAAEINAMLEKYIND